MDILYFLVDKYDNIRNKTSLPDSADISDAKNYFMKIKKIDEKGFDQVWRVMKAVEWDRIYSQSLQNNGGRQIEWWREEGDYLDLEKS
jgi:hypothetical protein